MTVRGLAARLGGLLAWLRLASTGPLVVACSTACRCRSRHRRAAPWLEAVAARRFLADWRQRRLAVWCVRVVHAAKVTERGPRLRAALYARLELAHSIDRLDARAGIAERRLADWWRRRLCWRAPRAPVASPSALPACRPAMSVGRRFPRLAPRARPACCRRGCCASGTIVNGARNRRSRPRPMPFARRVVWASLRCPCAAECTCFVPCSIALRVVWFL